MILGSRKSDLAVIQSESIAEYLKEKIPGIEIEFFKRPSLGDLDLDMDLSSTNSKGVFTSDFMNHLKAKDCDVVVHSWKDLPIESHKGFQITAGPYREDQRDVIFLKKTSYAKNLIKILTSSPRREFHIGSGLKDFLPFKTNFDFIPIRGNIPTRFQKFLDSEADMYVVAKAAIDRLMSGDSQTYKEIQDQIKDVFSQCYWMVLPLSEFPTSAAQGALALETLSQSFNAAVLKKLENREIYESVKLERETHKSYGGGCHQAMGFSAVNLAEGLVFYSYGKDGDDIFKTQKFYPKKTMVKKYLASEVFMQTQIKVGRIKIRKPHELTDNCEVVVARVNAAPETLNKDQHTLFTAGTKTWKKLAALGHWVNGSLDGLGVDHKPSFKFLSYKNKYWFTNDEASLDGLEGYQKVDTYNVNYHIEADKLEGKKVFYWMSGNAFLQALKLKPEIKEALHFCGLGRTRLTLKKHLPEERIYYALNEESFLQQATTVSHP